MSIPAEIFELLRVEVENRGLIVLFVRGKVQRIPQSAIHRDAAGCTPRILHEVLLRVCAVADLLRLHVDREALHLAEQEAGEWRASVSRAGQVCEQAAELIEA